MKPIKTNATYYLTGKPIKLIKQIILIKTINPINQSRVRAK